MDDNERKIATIVYVPKNHDHGLQRDAMARIAMQILQPRTRKQQNHRLQCKLLKNLGKVTFTYSIKSNT